MDDRGLPQGTVTFLLTDVEGSTALWQERPADMPAAIARHYDLLDGSIRRHRGVRPVEQGEGDSIVAAFSRVDDALAAAVDAQLALQEELPWLPVRIALHTGDVTLRDAHNYAGIVLSRCARLRACGHGGQVLASDVTRALADDSGVPCVGFIDLGRVRLRDLTRPKRVWQVVADGLRTSFGPLRSLDAVPHNLPVPLTSFVGRERERAELAGSIAEHRLVTLTGSGGCGKSRLALEIAGGSATEFPGGVWWTELAPVGDAAGVAEAIGTAIGFLPTPGGDAMAQLAQRLREAGPVLLVLDNAEHLLDATAATVARLLAGCAQLHVLVTSREALAVDGEVVWRVPSLPAPPAGGVFSAEELTAFDAAALFVDRARRVRPHLTLDGDVARAVAVICQRLDGLPLALELAAARVRSMSLDRVVAGLDDAFRLLAGGSRTAVPRQQTLLASIAWSADLLDPRQAAVLRRLAIFQSSFTAEAAEAVAGDGDVVDRYAVGDALSSLVDKSLLLLDDTTGRYRMLETIRQYGIEQLRHARELASTRARHAAWCVSFAEKVGEGRHGLLPERWMASFPDVVAALEWAYQSDPTVVMAIARHLMWAWPSIGSWTTVERIADWLLPLRPDDDTASAWAAALLGVAPTALMVGRSDVVAAARDSHEWLRDDRGADRTAQFLIDGPLSWRTLEEGRLAAVVEDSLEERDLLAYWMLAAHAIDAATMRGDLDLSGVRVAAALEVARAHALPVSCDVLKATHRPIVEYHLAIGDLHTARSLVGAGEPHDATMVFPSASAALNVALALGDDELVASTRRWLAREPSAFTRPLALSSHAILARHDGELDRAAALAAEGWRLRGQLTANAVPSGVRTVQHLLAAGRREEAGEVVRELEAIVRALPGTVIAARYELAVALVALHDQRADELASAAHRMADLVHARGFRLLTVDSLELVAVAAAMAGRRQRAAQLLAAAATERATMGYVGVVLPDPRVLEELRAASAADEPEAWAGGSSMDVAGAVDLARRARGRRGRPTVGWESLTPTERRVAELAALGQSNAEIGKGLLMSPATVKTHLGRVFGKLGLQNRVQLTAAVVSRPG